MKILVVDDDPDFCQMLQEWLTKEGYHARTIDGGPEVLATVQENQYDAVILDLYMPNANGLTLISRIRSLRPNTQVIVISAVADVRVAVEAARAGADACMEKPVQFTALRNELTTFKRRSNLVASKSALALDCEMSKP